MVLFVKCWLIAKWECLWKREKPDWRSRTWNFHIFLSFVTTQLRRSFLLCVSSVSVDLNALLDGVFVKYRSELWQSGTTERHCNISQLSKMAPPVAHLSQLLLSANTSSGKLWPKFRGISVRIKFAPDAILTEIFERLTSIIQQKFWYSPEIRRT